MSAMISIMEKSYTSPKTLLAAWLARTHLLENSHYTACNYYKNWHHAIGLPATALSAIVSTSVFVSLTSDISLAARIGVGLISVLVAILAGLQTFLRSSERSQKHLIAGVQFGILRRDIERHLAFDKNVTEDVRKNFAESINQRLDALSKESPEIPQRIFDKEQDLLRTRLTDASKTQETASYKTPAPSIQPNRL